jgi:SNF2 family DNA or RNA helicase
MLLHAATRSVVLQAPDPLILRDLMPAESRHISHPDFNITVKHTLETAKLLNNIGFKVQSPIVNQYKFPGKYKPFAHQIEMASFMTLHDRCFNLSEMGIGKTASALWAADYLMSIGVVRRVLILSPLSTLERVWLQDIFDVLMHRKAVVVHGSRENRREALGRDQDFYLLNHDGLKIGEVREALRKRPDIDLIIIDEAHQFRERTTDKFKSLITMLKPRHKVWALTGTPCPNNPTDAWALAQIVDPSKVPRFFGAFRRATMLQVTQFKWVPRADSYRDAYNALQPAIRFLKADCLTLPEMMPPRDHFVPLTKAQLAAYADMKEDMQATLRAGKITAVNAADKINKLRQICCGAIKIPGTDTYESVDHAPRVRAVLDLIAKASAKVLVVVPFKGIIKELGREIGQHHGVGVLNGDVSSGARNRIIQAFKTSADPRVLLCHPKVMAHGLNLVEADTLIFYAPIYSGDEYEQVKERFNRTGQTRVMSIFRIGGCALEWKIYQMVDGRRINQDSILGLYKSIAA